MDDSRATLTLIPEKVHLALSIHQNPEWVVAQTLYKTGNTVAHGRPKRVLYYHQFLMGVVGKTLLLTCVEQGLGNDRRCLWIR